MLGKKECFIEKFFLATLWAKLLIIAVNLGYKTFLDIKFLVKILDGT